MTKVGVLQTIALLVLMYPATDLFGITGTALAVLFSSLLTAEPIINYLAVREVQGSFRTFFWTLSIPLSASLVMSGGLIAIRTVYPIQHTPLHFVLFVATGAGLYVLSMLLFDKVFDYGSTKLFRSLAEAMA